MKLKIVRVIASTRRRIFSVDKPKKQGGSHPWERREIILPYFDTIRIHGGKAEVVVEQRERSSLCWRGWGRRAWPVEYSCRDGVLDIKVLNAPGTREPVKLYISTPSVNCLRLDGSSVVQTKHAVVAESFEVFHQGDGELLLKVNANKVETHCQGIGRLFLQGKTNYWKDYSSVLAEVNALGLFVTVI
ncbi:MAG: DUF2807 domain-containing protein [Saprospiraceae bacterium]|nr:DUF2807 domain-containing protein [Saprospiraceae bacterium]